MSFFKRIKDGATDAASGAYDAVTDTLSDIYNSVSDGIKAIIDAAQDLAISLKDRAANATDLAHLLNLIYMIPGIEKRKLDKELLDHSLMIIRFGNISCAVTYNNKDGVEADFMRIGRVTAAQLNKKGNTDQFTDRIVHQGRRKDPNIHMLINSKNFSENNQGLTAEVFVTAICGSISMVPIAGGLISGILETPIRKISQYLVDTAFEQAGHVAGYLTGNEKEQNNKQLPPPKVPDQKPAKPRPPKPKS